MLGQDNRPGIEPHVWFAVAMAIVVVVLLAAIHRGDGGSDIRGLVARQVARLQIETVSSGVAEPTASSLPSREPAAIAAVEATPTPEWLAPTPQPSPTRRPPDAPRQDHFWLERPIAPPGNALVSRTYPYGSRGDGSYPIHHGVEMVNPVGTPVRAPASGVIVVAGDDETQVYGARLGFYGLLVIMQLDQRYQGVPIYVLMGHLSQVDVVVGQPVAAGEILGLVGASGYAEGPHLHTEVRLGRNDYMATVNPELWYRPLEGRGALAGILLTRDGQPVDSEVRLVLRRQGRSIHEVVTYPAQQVNPSPEWGENWAIGDLEAGAWTVEVFYGGRLYTRDVAIAAGRTTWLVIQTE